MKFSTLDFTLERIDAGEIPYDITLDVVEGSAGSIVSFHGQEYLYGVEETRILLDIYIRMIETFADDVQADSNKIEVFGQSQVQAALDAGRGRCNC